MERMMKLQDVILKAMAKKIALVQVSEIATSWSCSVT